MSCAFRRTLAAVRLRRDGFTLEATLIFMVLLAALLGAAMAGSVVVQRTAGVDYRASRVNYAAEAGADAVIAQLEGAMVDGVVTDAELGAVAPPALAGFAFTVAATRVGGAVPRTITTGPYAGLIGLNQRIDVAVQATDPTANRGDVVVSVNSQSIPLFQFGVFYEEDLEIHNGPPMTFAGWVHTNGNLHLSSDNSFFRDIITTPDSVFWRRKNTTERRGGVWINDATGTAVRLQFDSRDYAGDAPGFVNRSQADFDGRLMTGASGVTPLRLPLPLGMPPIEMIRPRTVADPVPVREVKFAWKALDPAFRGWHITVDAAQLGTLCTSGLTHERPGGLEVPDAAACALIFRGTPNAFHEGREGVGADVVEIDLGQLRAWAAGNVAARWPGVLYVTVVNADPTFTAQARDYPVLRLVNGAELLEPLTVATDRPLYVRGDYNTVGWQPASLLGDAITFLSNAWTDAGNPWPVGGNPLAPPAFAMRNAASTTVFAAIAAGHSATPCDVNRVAPACTAAAPPPLVPATGSYGGGLENFPRFLEDWSPGGAQQLFTYRGSLVSLFQSQVAARYRWSWRGYYDPPRRDWEFDLRFRDPRNLPPGTPAVGSVVQTAFRPVY